MGGGRGSEPFRSWCTSNSKSFSLFRYGTLTGENQFSPVWPLSFKYSLFSYQAQYICVCTTIPQTISQSFAELISTDFECFLSFPRCSTIGGVPGAEPLPFVGLPLLEPELHPSYVLRSVVLTSPTSNQYASAEVCTRGAIGEAVGKSSVAYVYE